jgi:hypothetical protein
MLPSQKPHNTRRTVPEFRNATYETVYTELDEVLGKAASVHTLSIRLALPERTIRSALSHLYKRGLADKLTANVWTTDVDGELHPYKCRCVECDPDWHRDLARF